MTSVATDQVSVRFLAGESYLVSVRDHELLVDQPYDAGGDDMAPSPVEVFVGSLAACVAFYAGRYLTRHGQSRSGLAVSADYELAADRPTRIGAIWLRVTAPALPVEARHALHSVVSRCTVHNTLVRAPEISIKIASGDEDDTSDSA